MELQRYQDVHSFYDTVESFLVEHEAENNLMLGIASDLATSTLYADRQPYLATVSEGGRVIAAALRTPPHNLVISRSPAEAAGTIAADIQQLYSDLPGVLGPKDTSQAFSQAWMERTGQPFRLGVAQRIYQLDEVTPPDEIPGQLRPFTQEDADLVLDWLLAFQREAYGGAGNPQAAERLVQVYLKGGVRELHIWQDGQPVAMVGYSGRTPNGIRVGPVYTPPEFRRRGYGTAATAAITQYLLDSGHSYCFLFTDLSNPTSNRIYQRIGYRPVVDVDEYRFGA